MCVYLTEEMAEASTSENASAGVSMTAHPDSRVRAGSEDGPVSSHRQHGEGDKGNVNDVSKGDRVEKQEKPVSGQILDGGAQAEHTQRKEQARLYGFGYESKGYYRRYQERGREEERGGWRETREGRRGGRRETDGEREGGKGGRDKGKAKGVEVRDERSKEETGQKVVGEKKEAEFERLEDGGRGPRNRAKRDQWRGGRRERDGVRVEGGRRRPGGKKETDVVEVTHEEDQAPTKVDGPSSGAQEGDSIKGKQKQNAGRGRHRYRRNRDYYDEPVRQGGYQYDQHDWYEERGNWKGRRGRRDYGKERRGRGEERGRKQTGDDREEQAEPKEQQKDGSTDAGEMEEHGDKDGEGLSVAEAHTAQVEIGESKEQVPSLSKSGIDRQPPTRQRRERGEPRRWQEREGRPRGRGKRVVPTVQSDELAQELLAGQYECMVCCDRVSARDQIWSCGSCFHVFHLRCIKKWATSPAAVVTEGRFVG